MDNPKKLAIYGTQDEEKHNMRWTPLYANKIKTQHTMCWTLLYANNHT